MVILIFIMISSYLIVNSHNLFIISWSQLIVNSHTYLLFIVHTSYLFIISYHCHTSPIFIIMTLIVHVLCLFILITMNNKVNQKINNGVVHYSPGDFLIWKYRMLKHRIRFIKDWHQICNHLERLQLFQIFIKLLLTILMLSPVLIETFNIFKFASACLKLIRKAFELYKDSEMTHWLRTRFQQAEEKQLYRPDSLHVSFKDFLLYYNLMLTLWTEGFFSLRKDILFAFFFSKASSSRTTQLLHWGLNSLPDLAELLEYLSFTYLIFPVVLLGKPQDVVAHLTDLSKWLMSLVSQILHLHYRILTIEWRLQNLEHL